MYRTFSSDNNDNNNNDDNNSTNNSSNEEEEEDDQSFFLNNDEENLPQPPSYIRDTITGKWTSETLAELSREERKLINLDEDSQNEELLNRLEDRWKAASYSADDGVKETGDVDNSDLIFGKLNSEHERIAHRIQDEKLAMGVIGRNPADSVKIKKTDDEDTDASSSSADDSKSTDKPLTPREYQALKTYAQKEYNVHPKDFDKSVSSSDNSDESLIPINNISSGSGEGMSSLSSDKQFFDADLDLAYLNPKMNKRAFKDETFGDNNSDDPFADLLPSDLNPARKVNRQNAKLIPKRLLHHNNLSLLRRYTTPGGKIMNRVQSRLGAKDQRKIAKLVKRARHMGFIPHLGQWKYEDHGNLYDGDSSRNDNDTEDDDGDEEGKRDWEVELEKRGLWPLQNETELIQKYYDMDKIMDHIAGPLRREDGTSTTTNKKRDELERLLGGVGALVKEKEEETR